MQTAAQVVIGIVAGDADGTLCVCLQQADTTGLAIASKTTQQPSPTSFLHMKRLPARVV